ncbi:MAG: peptide chain release factor 3 [Vulcanimicrobiaceae bacterium]
MMHLEDPALAAAVARRRTFAIISHPDAGKTTLTEKLLLYGGAINTAGQVMARRRARAATSDWMALERERGISITSTVLQFPYRGFTLNLLDTPGHQDFGEDTYRTLLAADSAIMLIDAAKGVEPQTEKLFAICRERGIPLFTFVNKLDRPSREPLELLDELERVLGIATYPMNYPLGNGPQFRGVYDRRTRTVHRFERTEHGATRAPVALGTLDDPRLRELCDEETYRAFREGIELLAGAGTGFDREAFACGAATPVFFGSAGNNFGIELFLEGFLELAPPPAGRHATDAASGEALEVRPGDERFTGFVFKIQANMDPRHRDRIAFVRICSGRFARDMSVQNARSGREVRLSRAMRLFASERDAIDEAYAGDVVGVSSPGAFAIGDSLAEGAALAFDPIPAFAPEHFAAVRSIDTAAYKSFGKGLAQLAEEGAIQLFFSTGPQREPILGAVGELQFEVAKYRLAAEYRVVSEFLPLPFGLIARVEGEPALVEAATWPASARLVLDREGRPVALFESTWSLKLAQEWNPALHFAPFAAAVPAVPAVQAGAR